MKRFLIISILILVIFILGIHFIMIDGLFLNLGSNSDVSVLYKTDEKSIMAEEGEGKYKEFVIKGVSVFSNIAGKNITDFVATEEDYLRWFHQISLMGANTVKVQTLMDDDFYNALYKHNTKSNKPLYLLQGIEVADELNQGSYSACEESFKDSLLKDGKRAVNIIHGKNIGLNEKVQGNGFYFKDISKWVIGYQIGNSWNQDLIAYTNNSPCNSSDYNGKFFKTNNQATPFEAVMAEIMDEIVSYETSKYGTQRLIGFINDRTTDFLEYKDIYARQLLKYATLDANNVLPTDNLKSGYYAAYNISEFCPDYLNYITDEQKAKISKIVSNIDREDEYKSYIQLLSNHHFIPVICSDFGISTSRATSSAEDDPYTEEEQGEEIVHFWRKTRDAKLRGVIIGSWQDIWQRRSWNTVFATDMNSNYLWHDIQTQGESYGIMKFCPKEDKSCIIDGKYDEWSEETPIITSDGREIFLKYDWERLYLLIKEKDISKEKSIFVPFDITDELGSTDCENPSLRFNRQVDFLLCINGKNNTRLLVQERFDQLRQNFGYEIGEDNPYLHIPAKDSNKFVPIRIAQTKGTILDTFIGLSPDQIRELGSLDTSETGLLIHGNGNPDDEDYNSLADFCFGKDCVEIGIPWLMLNVSNPLEMKVHKDYYDNYGIESEVKKEMWIGIGDGSKEIQLASVCVKDWDFDVSWNERLKQSYYAIKKAWS